MFNKLVKEQIKKWESEKLRKEEIQKKLEEI